MDRLVILHVTAPAAVGGLEAVVTTLSIGHARLGHEVHVAAVVETPEHADRFLRTFAAHRVHTHAIVIPARAYLRERAAVRELCHQVAPVVVHTHGYRADVLTPMAVKRLGLPLVTTVHGFTTAGWRGRLYEALQALSFRRFDRVIAVSRPL